MSSTLTIPPSGSRVRPAGGQLHLRVATTVDEIDDFREFWRGWQEHPNSIVESYFAQFNKDSGQRPYIMAVYRSGKPDCVLLGKQLPHGVISAVSRLLQPARRVFYFIEGGLLGNPSHENCRFLVSEIVARLRRGEADAAEFFGLRLNSSLYHAALEIPNFLCRDYAPLQLTHRFLLLPDSLQEFLHNLPAKERQNFSYRQRRLLKAFPGKVQFRRFNSQDDVERLIRDAEKIAQTGYQRALGRGFNLDEGPVLRVAARNGTLRAYILYIEENPCAYLMAIWHKGVLYGTYVGHNPEYDEYAPGRFLLMRCIEDCFAANGAEKTVILDPGVGDQAYKRPFTNVERDEAHITIHAPAWRGVLCNGIRTARSLARECAKRALSESRLLPLFQKLRRNRAVRKLRSAPATPPHTISQN